MKKATRVFLACSDSSGVPTFVSTKVDVSESEINTGYHYDLAIEKALEWGYEGPFVSFDEVEAPSFLMKAFKDGQIPDLGS